MSKKELRAIRCHGVKLRQIRMRFYSPRIPRLIESNAERNEPRHDQKIRYRVFRVARYRARERPYFRLLPLFRRDQARDETKRAETRYLHTGNARAPYALASDLEASRTSAHTHGRARHTIEK